MKAGVCAGVNGPFPQGISGCLPAAVGALQGLVGHTCPAERVFQRLPHSAPTFPAPRQQPSPGSNCERFPLLSALRPALHKPRQLSPVKAGTKALRNSLSQNPVLTAVGIRTHFLNSSVHPCKSFGWPTLLVLALHSGHNLILVAPQGERSTCAQLCTLSLAPKCSTKE